MLDQLRMKKDKTLKVENFQSRHLAQIIDAFSQVMKLFEEQEKELDNFLAQAEAITGKNYHDVEIGGSNGTTKGRILSNVIIEEKVKSNSNDDDEDDLLQ